MKMKRLNILSLLLHLAISEASELPVQVEIKGRLNSRLTNVHVSVDGHVDAPIRYTYGSCAETSSDAAEQVIAKSPDAGNTRLVWVLPDVISDTGCVSAWDSHGRLVGRSQQLTRQVPKKKRLQKRGEHSIPMDNLTGIDAWGPWFDGVKLLADRNLSAVDVAAAKRKDIAIVGAGMSGLMTYLILHQSGLTNVKILEASQRLGGRVHTEYLSGGPFDYSYQEMGPMRFPTTRLFGNETYNITDHQIVFQLADEMNRLNGHDKNLSVDFIPWIQSNENGFYYFDGIKLESTGLPPTIKQVADNQSLSITLPLEQSTQNAQSKLNAIYANETLMRDIAVNMHRAHKNFLVNGLDGLGGDTWSEFAYLVNYLGASLNDTNFVTGGFEPNSIWNILYETLQFGATTWRTIDGGLNRLPLSFHPLVDKNTRLNTMVERIQWSTESEKLNVQWRNSYKSRVFHNATFDYVILAVPPPQLQKMRLPKLPSAMRSAIDSLTYTAACKVALEYSSRFWEHPDRINSTTPSILSHEPIFGGQTLTDIPGIGTVSYPSYCLNCTGKASLLATYAAGSWGDIWPAVPEAEHIAYVVDAMAEIHGEVARELWTGRYARKCWREDPFESGSWTSPVVGQHELFLPEFFRTHSNMIFVGEHTAYTHAWISSALESGIRGAVQMLLELGLVDEAKDAVDKWMGRWLDV